MLVGGAVLERLQPFDALRERGASVQRRKLPSPAVAEPLGEGGGVTRGRHLHALRLFFRQGASENGLDLGVQGVFQRGPQLG
ncbi:hypothetical protein [Streptomyces phaeochromogenes]